MTIPIADHMWYRIPMPDLPKDHYAEHAMSGGDMIVRIVGPNAHVTGTSIFLNEAIEYALEWFSKVGGEL